MGGWKRCDGGPHKRKASGIVTKAERNRKVRYTVNINKKNNRLVHTTISRFKSSSNATSHVFRLYQSNHPRSRLAFNWAHWRWASVYRPLVSAITASICDYRKRMKVFGGPHKLITTNGVFCGYGYGLLRLTFFSMECETELTTTAYMPSIAKGTGCTAIAVCCGGINRRDEPIIGGERSFAEAIRRMVLWVVQQLRCDGIDTR